MKRIAALLLACIMWLSGRGAQEAESHAKQIELELVTQHMHHPDPEDETRAELLRELKETDRGKAKLWQGILEYWDYVNSDLEIRTKRLPGDLPKDDSLCIVVLGYELNADGSMSSELIGRLNTALDCAKQYPKAYVLCTGGNTALYNSEATEAAQMADWLTEHGIRRSRLILEEASTSTAENARNSYDILRKQYPKIRSAAIISSSYHIPWGVLMFEAEFRIKAEEGAPEMHVVSNCAYEMTLSTFGSRENLRCETAGMIQLLGNDALAQKYYYGTE